MLHQEALKRQSEADETIRTVYIGGGTPSLLPPSLFSKLIKNLRSVFDLDSVEEFTTEANPGTVTSEWLDSAVSLGVNRISLGMQAYQDRLLSLLGRIHGYDDVCSSVNMARTAGIRNISLDLIFGIPTQSIAEWEETVHASLALNPEHVSTYGLIPEDNTPLKNDLTKGNLVLPETETEREMYDLAIRMMTKAGFHQYEISSFALESHECQHNIGYWTQIPYLGLGISAASMSCIQNGPDGISYIRSTNPDTPDAYEKLITEGSFPSSPEYVHPPEARFETMMLGLRMNRGVNESAFLRLHRISLEQCYGGKLHTMEKLGLMIHENGAWKLTRNGFDIQNSILVELMDD